MIRFSLKCEHNHVFESWFASDDAFRILKDAKQLSCVECGSTKIEKCLMAPQVAPSRKASNAQERVGEPTLAEGSDTAKKIEKLKTFVEKNSHYVGDKFAQEARAMHLGDSPARPIHGQADATEAKALIEDGVPIAPLPFLPRQKTN